MRPPGSITLAAIFVLSAVPEGISQTTNGLLSISKSAANVTLSWNGGGSLQSAAGFSGPWRDILETPNPTTLGTTNAQQFFRVLHRWATRGNLLQPNSEMAVAQLGQKIYVLGGYPASRITVTTVQVYDAVLDTWQLTTSLPIPLNHAMAATANGKIYVIGGQTNADNSGSFVKSVFEFDPATTNWSARAPMPTARSAGAAAVIGSLIYVAGGRPPQGQDFAVYDASINQWTTLTNLPTGRNHLAAAAIGGKIYVAGGRLGAGFTSLMTDVLEIFDPAVGSWISKAPMRQPRGGINGIAVNGLFFVFGGEGPDGVFADNDVYAPANDRWYRLEPLPVPVHGVTGAAFFNGWIHLPGGGTAQGGSSGAIIHQVFWVAGIEP
jgi:N-acetylneuraminic acid mutarotase